MSHELIIFFGREAMFTTLLIAGPLLAGSLLIGLAVSVFQATTQIQEQTLAFIPKIVAVLGGVVVFGPWMLNVIIAFSKSIFMNLHLYTFIR
ncbi:flagellar biosynthetic protein FliQ [Desulfitispora alkaliphila]|uniref:flagellar biosynthesis protein FliQ n=1 Tax=Desulfitispora alkaliphila TaxID=622674 RepID=UPI003D1B4997